MWTMFVLSGICFFVLVAVPNIQGIIKCFVCSLCLILGTGVMRPNIKGYIKECASKQESVIASVIIALLSINFVNWWKVSSLVARIAQMLKLNKNVFLFLVASVLGITAYFFVLAIVTLFLNDRGRNKGEQFGESNCFARLGMVVCILFLGIEGYYAFSKSIWIDEVFSLQMIENSYKEMVLLTGMDVHPPLYYFILKAIVDVGNMLFPEMPKVYFAKFSSLIPYIILVYIVSRELIKSGNKYCAVMFCIAMVGMPQMMNYGIDIRMYNWAMLFVTLTYLAGWRVINNLSWGNWLKLELTTLFAAYMHYYACIAVAFVWLNLGIYCIYRGRNALKQYCIMAAATVVGYMPWVLKLLTQISVVKNDYWIEPITVQSIVGYVEFVFDNGYLLFVYVCACILLVKKICQNRRMQDIWALVGMGLPVFVASVGVIVSVTVKPVFVARYLFPTMGCMWLSTSFAYSTKENGWFKGVMTTIFLASLIFNTYGFICTEQMDKENANTLQETLSGFEGYKIITNDDFVNREIAQITGNECYLWSGKMSEITKAVYGNTYELNENEDKVIEWIQDGEKILFISSKNVQENVEVRQLNYVGQFTAGAKNVTQQIDVYEVSYLDLDCSD